VITARPPPGRVRPETVIVWPLVLTVPAVVVVHPTAFLVTGSDHPFGTVIVTAPSPIPPVPAVYVNLRTLPVELGRSLKIALVRVPEPSAE
jgi:hypothetical protein